MLLFNIFYYFNYFREGKSRAHQRFQGTTSRAYGDNLTRLWRKVDALMAF
jgi:hypothetical protein